MNKVEDVVKAIDRCVDAWLQKEKENYIEVNGKPNILHWVGDKKPNFLGRKRIEPEEANWREDLWNGNNYFNLRVLMEWKEVLLKDEKRHEDYYFHDCLMFGLNELQGTYKNNSDISMLMNYYMDD